MYDDNKPPAQQKRTETFAPALFSRALLALNNNQQKKLPDSPSTIR